jgi:isoleucyl-tRNA synthetase
LEAIAELWKREKILDKLKKRGKEVFYLCDGPPYVTGELHLGHIWNKSLKDCVIKYKLMNGYNVYSRAGYDTHGLPIEVQVEKKLKIKDKKEIERDIENFIKNCMEYVDSYMAAQTNDFERFGIWQDFEDPYITYKDEYIEKCWSTIKAAHEKGLLINDYYVIYYCPRCQTPLANYELEYKDAEDPSIYVKFEITENEKEKKRYLLIWTTTPWTIVGNVAVMAHPTFKYVEFDTGNEILIVAKDCLDRVIRELELSGSIIREFSGKELTKLKYHHPLSAEVPIQNYDHPVVMSEDFVTTEEGTGLVHCAPGHGQEDYIVGKRYDLPIFSPISTDAKYTAEAGKYQGISVLEANEVIMDELDKKGLLLKRSKIKHRYPFCWRCKTKLIQVASLQWFIKITAIKEHMIEENKKVIWIPKFAGEWFEDFLESSRDWCISRQRYWGIPLPIWKCECGKMRVIGSKSELEELSGKKVTNLHRPYIDEIRIKCECGKDMERVKDVIDVWFDSGNAVWAGTNDESLFPADLIIEGKDQIRGWFYSLLGCSIIKNGSYPYRRVLMHGYVVDEKGMAMHKSLGNYIPLKDILEKHSEDTIRLWCLSNVIWDDLRFSWKGLSDCEKDINVLVNIASYLERFKDKIDEDEKSKLNEWLLSSRNSLIKEYKGFMESYSLHLALRAVRKYVIDDISRFYMKFVKGKGLKKLYDSYLVCLQLLAPFIPFTVEQIYQRLYRKKKEKESIFLLDFPREEELQIDKKVEKYCENIRKIIEHINSIRNREKIPVRQPVEEIIIGTRSIEIKESIKTFEEEIKELVNAKRIRIDEETKVAIADSAKELEAYDEITKLSQEQLLLGKIVHNGKEIDFSKYLYVSIPEFSTAIVDFGFVGIKTKLSEDLIKERIINEVRRRIQQMRKESNLIESDKIDVHIHCKNEAIRKVIAESKTLKEEINAKSIYLEKGGKYKKKWNILNEEIEIGITKI